MIIVFLHAIRQGLKNASLPDYFMRSGKGTFATL